MKSHIAGLMVAGLVSASQLPGFENNDLQEQIADNDFDRELQFVEDEDIDLDEL